MTVHVRIDATVEGKETSLIDLTLNVKSIEDASQLIAQSISRLMCVVHTKEEIE